MNKSFEHGGNIEEIARKFRVKKDSIIDFSSNVNPFFCPQYVAGIMRSSVSKTCQYPDRKSTSLKKALGKHLNIDARHIVIGNGSSDLIYRMTSELKPKSALTLAPTFGEYEKALMNVGAKIKYLFLQEKNNFSCSVDEIINKAYETNILFLCNPNNPTGKIVPRQELERLILRLRRKKTILVLDEAFIDLEKRESIIDLAVKNDNLLVLRSMTKFFGLPGLRLGYAVGSINHIRRIENFGQPWPVNVFAQSAGELIIKDKNFEKKAKKKLLNEREYLYRQLRQIKGLEPFPSSANFILIKIEGRTSSHQLQSLLIKRNLLIRDCSNFRGLGNKYIRVAVRKRTENKILLNELENILGQKGRK